MTKIDKMLENKGLRHLEVFHVSATEAKMQRAAAREYGVTEDMRQMQRAGFYYWFSLPGCMPDSDAFGPFRSETAAIKDAFNTFSTWE